MNSIERAAEKFNSRIEESLSLKELTLAWITFHYQNPGAHPDDYMDTDGAYKGWHVLMARRMFDIKPIDDVMYPVAVLKIDWLMDQLDMFHNDDDDETFTEKIDTIRNFFEDIRPEELKETIDALGDLINYHDGAPEDVFSEMSSLYDVLHWISIQN